MPPKCLRRLASGSFSSMCSMTSASLRLGLWSGQCSPERIDQVLLVERRTGSSPQISKTSERACFASSSRSARSSEACRTSQALTRLASQWLLEPCNCAWLSAVVLFGYCGNLAFSGPP